MILLLVILADVTCNFYFLTEPLCYPPLTSVSCWTPFVLVAVMYMYFCLKSQLIICRLLQEVASVLALLLKGTLLR